MILDNINSILSMHSTIHKRPQQIVDQYSELIDHHLEELVAGTADNMFEIEDFARLLFIHPTHLSNTVKEVAGTSPCGIYQLKILDAAKKLLSNPAISVRDAALQLTFEPSQFTKWFKRFAGLTPKQFKKTKY